MSDSDWRTTGALALGTVAMVIYFAHRSLGLKTSPPLPPGPPGLPWVGTIIGIDGNAPWITYAEWAKTYGDIVYSRFLGNDIIILNSEKVARDLLENRSKNYSDRPRSITGEMCGIGLFTVFSPYGDPWRLQRRFFHQTFKPDAVYRFLPIIHHKTCSFLRQLLDSPKQLDDHLSDSAIIMNSTYDYDPASSEDEFIDIIMKVATIIIPLVRPDFAMTIGAFPWLLRFPAWFPGMSFKTRMAISHKLARQYLEQPFEYAVQRVNGSIAPSMVRDALQGMEKKEIIPEASWTNALKQASATAFLAAFDSSDSVLLTFFLVMVINQGAQQRAQTEIDAVVGTDRLPAMEDRPSLPFIDAILRETLRYNPIAPISVPHATVESDVYEGYHIPKGAIVLSNLWAMSRDESKYPDAHAFVPERFINEDGSLKPNNIEHIAFGFGRRMCAGRHFGDAALWSVVAKVLAVFKILRPVDENGVEMDVEPKFSTGNFVHPLPFGYRIVPRFPGMDAEKLEQLIATSYP